MKKELILFLFICPLVFFYVFSSHIKKGEKDTTSELTLQNSFEELAGNSTDDWNYITTKVDYKNIEYYKALYKKNQQFQFTSDPVFKIPKIIHLIWIGPRPFPQESIEIVRSWKAHHPDWTFLFWTDRKRPPPCRDMEVRLTSDFDFQFLEEQFDESKNWGEKADILRLEIIYQLGGVYIDHDARCRRPFHGLHTGYDFYACLEMPHEGIENLSLTVGNAIFGARPYHPVIKEAMVTILNRWDGITKLFSSNDPYVQARRVAHRTYIALTYALKEGLNHPGNTDIIFPSCYFFPKHGHPGFYSEHLYDTTWHDLDESPSEKYFTQVLRDLRSRDAKILKVELFCLFALIGSFALYFLINRELLKKRKGP